MKIQAGASLVEMLISLTIGLFLLSGIVGMFYGVKQTYQEQSVLAQLQNNQQLALNIINTVFQTAGYYQTKFTATSGAAGQTTINTTNTTGLVNNALITGTGIPANTVVSTFVNNASVTISNPLTASASGIYTLILTPAQALPAPSSTVTLPTAIISQSNAVMSTVPTLSISFAAGQGVYGGSLYSSGPDTIAIRSEGAMDCTGNVTQNTPIISVFTVYNNQLLCAIYNQSSQTQGNWNILVTGVSSMSLLYGINLNPAQNGAPIQLQYVTAAGMQANSYSWSSVVSVRVNLQFVNPLYNAAALQGQLPTISFIRVVGIMGAL